MAEQAKPKDPQKELEILVAELEERVDRLRALYEQYFLGFEKIEPSVPRKDVDRRFTFLRKQQIRNTALRFKFNVITQKFQTYSMYWARVCRQIEEGTYKRHVVKAAQKFSDAAQKRRSSADIEVDIDMNDFGERDIDALLAEVDAEAANFQREGYRKDTLPPMPTDPPAAAPPPQAAAAAIPVAPGSRPRIVLRKAPIAGALSPGQPAPRPPAPSVPHVATPVSPILPKAPVIRPAGAPPQRIPLPSAATGPTPAPVGPRPTPSSPIQPRPIIRRAVPAPERDKKEP